MATNPFPKPASAKTGSGKAAFPPAKAVRPAPTKGFAGSSASAAPAGTSAFKKGGVMKGGARGC